MWLMSTAALELVDMIGHQNNNPACGADAKLNQEKQSNASAMCPDFFMIVHQLADRRCACRIRPACGGHSSRYNVHATFNAPADERVDNVVCRQCGLGCCKGRVDIDHRCSNHITWIVGDPIAKIKAIIETAGRSFMSKYLVICVGVVIAGPCYTAVFNGETATPAPNGKMSRIVPKGSTSYTVVSGDTLSVVLSGATLATRLRSNGL